MAPTNVLAAWRAYETNKAIASGAKKPPVKKPGSKEEIARLQQETDDQRAELKKVKAALVIMKSSASTMAAKVWEANQGSKGMSAKEWQDFITVLRGMWSTRVVRKTAAEDEDDAKAVKGRHKPGNARQGLAEAQAARELAPAAFALSVKPKKKVTAA